MKNLKFCFFLLLALLFSNHYCSATVVSTQDESVTITGVLTYERFPNVNGGLEAWDSAILNLDHPIDVTYPIKMHKKKETDGSQQSGTIPDNTRMQLILPTGTDENSIKGKRVMLSGQLFLAETAHHHTKVLMTVKTMKIFKAKPTKASN